MANTVGSYFSKNDHSVTQTVTNIRRIITRTLTLKQIPIIINVGKIKWSDEIKGDL